MSSSLSNVARNYIGKLKPENTVFLLCDIQERFRSITWHGETIIRTANYMTSVAKALDIPIVVTQQYTKVFGPTVEDVFADKEHFESCKKFEKKNFSMCTDEVKSHLNALNKKSVVLFGIEAHVCVQQTCLDLLEEGTDVHLIADGISSQQPFDREIALQRMSQAGAFLTTAQSTAFMLMQSAEHENFKSKCISLMLPSGYALLGREYVCYRKLCFCKSSGDLILFSIFVGDLNMTTIRF